MHILTRSSLRELTDRKQFLKNNNCRRKPWVSGGFRRVGSAGKVKPSAKSQMLFNRVIELDFGVNIYIE